MVAFSGCMYDGGETEKSEMDAIREMGWGKKFMLKNRISAPGLNRVNGKCPMTPVEVSFVFQNLFLISLFSWECGVEAMQLEV